jgi:hypothetical protein
MEGVEQTKVKHTHRGHALRHPFERQLKSIWNRTKKSLAIALSGTGRVLRGRDDGGNVNNVQYKSNWNCHYEFPV